MIKNKRLNRFRNHKRAVSPAISTVIITAVTIVLVLVAGQFAYRSLDQQRGASEFETVQKSILAFDDALRDIAWNRQGARSTHFTVKYGLLEVIPNALPLTIDIAPYGVSYSTTTAYLQYSISTDCVNYGNGYKSYILGDNKTIIPAGTDSFGQALVKQESGRVNVLLSYRVRAVLEGPPMSVNSSLVNYVDILIIRIVVSGRIQYWGDFDLVAKNLYLTTDSYAFDIIEPSCIISTSLSGAVSSIPISLDASSSQSQVVFNFITANVQITT